MPEYAAAENSCVHQCGPNPGVIPMQECGVAQSMNPRFRVVWINPAAHLFASRFDLFHAISGELAHNPACVLRGFPEPMIVVAKKEDRGLKAFEKKKTGCYVRFDVVPLLPRICPAPEVSEVPVISQVNAMMRLEVSAEFEELIGVGALNQVSVVVAQNADL